MGKDLRGPDRDVFHDMRGDGRDDAIQAGNRKPKRRPAGCLGTFLAILLAMAVLFIAICLLAGGLIMGVVIDAATGEYDALSWMDRISTAMGAMMFFLPGALCLVAPGAAMRRKARRYSVPVDAVAVGKDVRERRDALGRVQRRLWRMTWEYHHMGRRYVYPSDTWRSSEHRDIGDRTTLYISPSDPADVWERTGRTAAMILMALGILLILSGVSFLLSAPA